MRSARGVPFFGPTSEIAMQKKSEILKFRVDASTSNALRKLCDQTGQTASDVLRLLLARELRDYKPLDDNAVAPDGDAAVLEGVDPRQCARLLSSIFLGPQPQTRRADLVENWRRRRSEVSALLEALFRELSSTAKDGRKTDKGPDDDIERPAVAARRMADPHDESHSHEPFHAVEHFAARAQPM